MRSSGLLLLNAEEVRRRSLKVWRGIPADRLTWRPDPEAMSCQEMVRHVLEGEYLYMLMIRSRRSVPQDLASVTIDRDDAGYKRKLGDFVLRVTYHEAIHCGQLLGYLRAMGADRPRIWD